MADAPRAGGSTRIDSPHLMTDAGAEWKEEELLADLGGSPLVEQLRLQASQLAEHLRKLQQDLNRRESELNARQAQLENEMRQTRLWVREQSHVFQQQEQQTRAALERLDRRQAEAEAATAAAEVAWKTHQARLAALHEELRQREAQLDDRESRLDVESREVEQARQQARQNDASQRELLALRESIVAQQTQLQRQAEQLALDRRMCDQRREEFDRRQAEAEAACQSEWDHKLQYIARHRDALRESQRTAEQTQTELLTLYEHAVEARLAAFRLWETLAASASTRQKQEALANARREVDELRQSGAPRLSVQLTALAARLERLEA